MNKEIVKSDQQTGDKGVKCPVCGRQSPDYPENCYSCFTWADILMKSWPFRLRDVAAVRL